MTPEAKFKMNLSKRLQHLFPGIVILKGNSQYQQGLPDWFLFYQDRWAMLEVKAYEKAKKRPNQPHFVEQFNEMSFAAFVYPENVEEVLHDLQRHLQPTTRSRRQTFVSVSE